MATTPTVALKFHVAGPPEREPYDSPAGWRWAQRCLRCDCRLDTEAVWWVLGSTVYELDDDRMTTEPPPGSSPDSAARCSPDSAED